MELEVCYSQLQTTSHVCMMKGVASYVYWCRENTTQWRQTCWYSCTLGTISWSSAILSPRV